MERAQSEGLATREALDLQPEMMGLLGRGADALLPSHLAREAAPRELLSRLVKNVAIPRLLSRRQRVSAPLPLPSPRVGELADLLIAPDPTAAFELVRSLQAEADSLGALCASVLEPAARRLGDLWSSDDCSELDVTIGLCRLQTALRRTDTCHPPLAGGQAQAGIVLVAPQPGERHMLGSVLDAEILWQAGWETHCEYPATDGALQEMLADTWFDALDLSMSLAFRRDERLPRMAQTIRQARKASCNPMIRIVVGGRVFLEQPGTNAHIGADAESASAAGVEVQMDRVARARAGRRGS